MRRLTFAFVGIFGLALLPSVSHGQFNNGLGDPFFLYYGYYLPQQAYLASIPRQEDNLRAMAIQRQLNASTERATLYEPMSALMGTGIDPIRSMTNPGRERIPRTSPTGLVSNHIRGTGPSSHYGGAQAYFPTLRTGAAGLAQKSASGRPSAFGSLKLHRRGGMNMGGMAGMGGMGGFQ